MSQSRRMDFIVWMDYTASAPEKSFGLLDEETGCYIALPIEWEGNLMLTDSTDEEDAVELRTVDENKLVLTLRLASSSGSVSMMSVYCSISAAGSSDSPSCSAIRCICSRR